MTYIPPAERTHCPQGHPYDEANTRIYKGRRHCRACTKEAGRRYRELNPERVKELQRESRARNAAKIRAYEASPKELKRRAAAKRRRLANDPEALRRSRESQKRWRERNRLRQQVYLANWKAEQRGLPGSDYCTIERVAARIAFYGTKCAYCGDDYRELDHRIPLSRGGSGFPSNLVPCCRFCNVSKRDKTPLEWKRAA